MNGAIDAELLGRLLDEHGPALALYAAQWTDAADDCVQEALIELARQHQTPQHVTAWLYRVVKNRALNQARGERRRRERELQAMAVRLAQSRDTSIEVTADTASEALLELDASERELIIMRVWGNLKFEEIAGALNTSVSTAYRNYKQALLNLRKLLETPCTTSNHKKTTE